MDQQSFAMRGKSTEKNYHALTQAIKCLGISFDNIFFPLKPFFYYDIIAEKNYLLFKIKVVYTNTKQPNGVYVATIRKCGKNSIGKISFQPFDLKMCDFIFINTPESNYLIPTSEINSTRSISVNMYPKFLIPS